MEKSSIDQEKKDNIECPNWQAEDKASGNPSPASGLHVAEPFGLTGEGAKGEFLAPLNNQCSR